MQFPQDFINKIFFTDGIKLLKRLPDNSVDLIITDPPYGVDFVPPKKDDPSYIDDKESVMEYAKLWMREWYRVLKPQCHIYLFVPILIIDEWISLVKEYFTFNNIIATQCYITNTTASIKNNFGFDFQPVLYASKGKAKDFNEVDWIPTSKEWFNDSRNKNPKPFTYMYPSFISNEIIRANTKPNKQIQRYHPNEKNPEFIANLITMSTQKNDIVLEPFCGSGSTIIACIDTNRRYISSEKNKTYYIRAKKRVEKYQNQGLTKYMI